MKVDVENSIYQEHENARQEFNRKELRRCRYLLRRLRFLETKVAQTGGLAASDASGGAAHAEWEAEALEWLLTEVGYLTVKKGQSA